MDPLFWWCWIVCWTAAGLPTALTSPAADEEEGSSVAVESEPEFIQPIGNVTVAQGRDAVLSCSIAHLNDYTVGWVKVDTKAIQATGRRVVTLNTRVSVENIPGSDGSSTWKLVIKSAQPVDAGYYMAQINTNPMKSQMTYLSVMEPPNIDDQATPSVRQVRENESVVLHCQATGQPVPKITWRREDGANLSHNSHCNGTANVQQADIAPRGYGQLCIASASRSSIGTYYCIASNGVLPSVSKRIQLVVLFPTLVRAERPLIGHSVGALFVNLDCIVEASPQPNHLIWYKGNSSVNDSKRYSTSVQKINVYTTRMTLTIYYLLETDADFYQCQAGKMKASIQLYVVIPSTTTATTTTLQSSTTAIRIETTAKKLRPTRMSSTYSPAAVQSTRSTTNVVRLVPLDTPDEIGVLTSSNRPVKGMIYKNITNYRGRSSSISSPTNSIHLPIFVTFFCYHVLFTSFY